ncbi:MAG: ABC transporter permease subunit [Planctomycetes bacterium]|nr:ABC transporter permease subunit [Planctomycetota bacterium]
MKNIINLTKRECLSYFYTPLAYVIMTGFLFFTGVFFYQIIKEAPNTEAMRGVLDTMSFITLIIMPMITMRLLAEEKKSGTLEMLMTAPVTESEIVLAKFFGGFIFFLFLVIPTFIYVVMLMMWGNPDLGSLITGYLGLLLMGASFVAIGLFVSSFTSNQIVAAIITFVILIIGWIFGWISMSLTKSTSPEFIKLLGNVMTYLGFFEHLDAFRKGLIDSRDVVYYLSLIGLFLFLSVRIVESKRWK